MFWLKVLYSRWSCKDGLQIATYTWEHPAVINIQNLPHRGSVFSFFLLQNDTQMFTTKQLSKFHINKDLKEINAISLQCLFRCCVKVLLQTSIYNCVIFASLQRDKSRTGMGTEKRHLLFHRMAVTKVTISLLQTRFLLEDHESIHYHTCQEYVDILPFYQN